MFTGKAIVIFANCRSGNSGEGHRGSGTAEASPAGRGTRSRGNFEDVAGQERQDGERENGSRGLTRQDAKPEGSAKQDQEAAGSAGEKRWSERALAANAAAQEGGEGGGEWIGEKVAPGGTEKMQESGGTVGAEDGKTGCAFDEVEQESPSGGRGREKQTEEDHGKGLEGDGNRREPERNGDVRAHGDEE